MRVLMCPPDYIRIDEEINDWMDRKNQPDPRVARLQWQKLMEVYTHLGAELWFIDPDPYLQDMCFAANFAWCRGNKVILANFAHSVRMPEKQYVQLWFNRHRQKMLNVSVHELPTHIRFEGQGDVVTVDTSDGPLVLMGYGQGRTDYEATPYLADIHNMPSDRIIPMRLVNSKFYHLDMACNYIAPQNLFVYFPDAFDSAGKRIIESFPVIRYAVSEEDALRFTCNGVFMQDNNRKTIYVATNPTDAFASKLQEYDIFTHKVDVSEVGKNGGSARCLTLFLPEESTFPEK